MNVSTVRPGPQPDEVARVTSTAAELLEVLWGRASTAPASASQLRVLLILEHHEGINLRTLADSLASTPPSTSRLCDRLQATGFVERVVSPSDRREVRLRLSDRGRTFLEDLRRRRQRELQAVLDVMPAAKRAALLEGLEAFCDAAAGQIHHEADSDVRSA
ncbi:MULTISPECIES: MarR family winged helix-turn-helix transcriptional regulator [Streptomyces]|jgi:DNA-binding MarR family transcriptional regulator|uniref:MarR family transcriptional regulator n=1 Tax=Streptomyces vinaceusdrappus TaxID=67376 RepID=A0ABY6BMH9_9ACTN|nr:MULTISPECIES: MarR family transcriptional regulator [Streptomyces]MBQ0910784.1 MarR family transcriptional regulator [Streptomyces sp. RM99]MBX4173873.1 MarR family transcriptional regulator [Streptomyces geysiriensis]UXI76883.1 MarR family transcriptional regulator [Streptomyces vinaceusdrappus]